MACVLRRSSIKMADGPCFPHLIFIRGLREKVRKRRSRASQRITVSSARVCTTVLDQAEYSLLLTEAPDVPVEELRAAMRWRVKDLIDFHINDATLDVFDVPGERVAGRARQMYAVAARSAVIQKRVDLLDAANINLQVIDIIELAQRNLAGLLPEDARGVALLSFTAGAGFVDDHQTGRALS